jgi:hypothetical protein
MISRNFERMATFASSTTAVLFTPFYLSGHLYETEPLYSNKYHACVTVP